MDLSTFSSRRNLVNYNFSGTVDIAPGTVTHLPFVSVPAPFSVPGVTPTILRRIQADNTTSLESIHPIAAEGHSDAIIEPHVSRRTPSRASSIAPRQATPAPQVAPRQSTPGVRRMGSRAPTPAPPSRATPAPSIPVPSASSVRAASAPAPPLHGQPDSDGESEVPESASARGSSVPPENFEDYLPPRAGVSTRAATRRASQSSGNVSVAASSAITAHNDPDPMGFIRNVKRCQMTDEEKRAAALNKGKSKEERSYTAWFETEADEPRVSPPDLTIRPDLTAGDVFWHKSRRGVQLWVWLDEGEGLRWKPVSRGHYRDEDGRRLSLNPTGQPSWVREQWFRKKDNKNIPVFILKQ